MKIGRLSSINNGRWLFYQDCDIVCHGVGLTFKDKAFGKIGSRHGTPGFFRQRFGAFFRSEI